jgi:hypothetical protein
MFKVKVNGDREDHNLYVYQGPLVEVTVDIRLALNQKKEEDIMCIMKHESAHEEYSDCPAPLGYPLFCDDFIVFKNSLLGDEVYNEWLRDGHITMVLAKRKIMPCLLPYYFIKRHVDSEEQPKIKWGKDGT